MKDVSSSEVWGEEVNNGM